MALVCGECGGDLQITNEEGNFPAVYSKCVDCEEVYPINV
jgi:hypothetical protein